MRAERGAVSCAFLYFSPATIELGKHWPALNTGYVGFSRPPPCGAGTVLGFLYVEWGGWVLRWPEEPAKDRVGKVWNRL